MRRVVLASASPRRRDLMTLLRLPFTVWSGDIDETPRPGEPPNLLVARLSAAKAAAARSFLTQSGSPALDTLVVAADTVVVVGNNIFGKPANGADAMTMLQCLRGRAHKVYSAVAVVDVPSGRAAIHLNTTTVWMRDYTVDEIESYIRSGDPLDKAGAYAIQHAGFHPVARIEGCFTGVMGLPLGALVKGLTHFAVTPSVDVAAVCQSWTGYTCDTQSACLCRCPSALR